MSEQAAIIILLAWIANGIVMVRIIGALERRIELLEEALDNDRPR